jgi:hypothetical protein
MLVVVVLAGCSSSTDDDNDSVAVDFPESVPGYALLEEGDSVIPLTEDAGFQTMDDWTAPTNGCAGVFIVRWKSADPDVTTVFFGDSFIHDDDRDYVQISTNGYWMSETICTQPQWMFNEREVDVIAEWQWWGALQ